MKKKIKVSLTLIFLVTLMSSCVGRRYDYLKQNRLAKIESKEEDLEKEEESSQAIFPDEIVKLSFEDYKTWYEGLEDPPQLNLPSQEEPKKLSKDQKIEDFEYYFKQMEENYPFFGVLKREYGIDFLANHDEYLEKVEATKTDEEFISVLKEINSDLNNHHANIADKAYVEKTQEYFSHYWKNPSMYYEFLSLNTQKVRNRYDLEGFQSRNFSTDEEERVKEEVNDQTIDAIENKDDSDLNMTIEDLGDGIALIKVKEMVSGRKLDEDREVLNEFLENKEAYSKLVIDIRDNAGGSMDYWKDFLLPELLTEDTSLVNHMFFKGGDKTTQILELENENVEAIENINLDELELTNKEDLKDFAYYKESPVEVKVKGEGFAGYIFLLTNENVFSAAEGLASFAKNTGSAIIVGSPTGGDGITMGLVNDVLPNSGLVFTYTNTLGYGPDGTINEEEKTKPDINASSYKESLEIIRSYQ